MQRAVTIDRDRISQVAESLPVELVILFGSHADGALPPRRGSDLDLAVLFSHPSRPDAYRQVFRALDPLVAPAALDLVIVNGSEPLLRLEIMTRGVLLYGDPELFEEHKLLAYRIFRDSADLRELEAKLFRKRMNYIREVLDGAA